MDLTWEGVESFIGGRTVRSDAPVLNDFLRQQPVRRLVDVTVRKLCKRNGISFARYGDDFTAEVNAIIFLILTNEQWSDRAHLLSDFPRGLFQLSRNKFASITESAAWIGSSGMSTQVRRRRALGMHRARMIKDLEREPSNRELIDSYNEAIRASRKDAARQGMIATEGDLAPLEPASLDVSAGREAASDDVYPLLTPQAGPLAEEIIRRSAMEDPLLGIVARAWLGTYQDEVFATSAAIAAELGIDLDDVIEAQRAIQAVTVLVLRDWGMPE